MLSSVVLSPGLSVQTGSSTAVTRRHSRPAAYKTCSTILLTLFYHTNHIERQDNLDIYERKGHNKTAQRGECCCLCLKSGDSYIWVACDIQYVGYTQGHLYKRMLEHRRTSSDIASADISLDTHALWTSLNSLPSILSKSRFQAGNLFSKPQ